MEIRELTRSEMMMLIARSAGRLFCLTMFVGVSDEALAAQVGRLFLAA